MMASLMTLVIHAKPCLFQKEKMYNLINKKI